MKVQVVLTVRVYRDETRADLNVMKGIFDDDEIFKSISTSGQTKH